MKGKDPIFRGAATALVTPFTETGVDYESFGRLIDWQIEKGIDALVIAGTSGEGSTLSDAEHKAVIKFAVEKVNHRVPVIAGTGSNETPYAIELSQYACSVGADGLLVVTPYYNKATQKGLVKMYYSIADATDKPIIVYNVPSRTGVNIEPRTYVELARHDRIVAIKEANGNISKIVETCALVGDRLDIYSGNDDQIVPMLSVGGQGVISVLSNIMPAETSRMCHLYFEGKVKESAKMQMDLLPLINALFCEVNPIPVKTAMGMLGYKVGPTRSPLTPMEAAHAENLKNEMKKLGILK